MINTKKIKLIIDEKIFESLFTYNIHTFFMVSIRWEVF